MPVSASEREIERQARALYDALRTRRVVEPLARDLSIDDAYAISLALLRRRERDGEKVIGKKIGVTSKAVQDLLGVRQPDFGFLTDAMRVGNGAEIDIAAKGLIQPRAEAEIAFVLRCDLVGPGITESDVMEASDYLTPCIEIVDSRIAGWRIGIVDTIADNASCGVFLVGDGRISPDDCDAAALRARLFKNGEQISEGTGVAVQGSPLTAVAWLANTLGRYGVPLLAGETILSGSLVPLEPARAGDRFEMQLDGVGGCAVSFR